MSVRAAYTRGLLSSVSLVLLVLGLTTIPAAGGPARPAAALLPAPLACNQSAGHCWKPAVKARWQYQLQGSPGRVADVATRARGSSTSE